MIHSEMKFKNFSDDSCYHIEESAFYQKKLKSSGYKTVEFVVCCNRQGNDETKWMFIEAKTVVRMKFDKEISDISQKFMDALQIVCGIGHTRNPELPNDFISSLGDKKNIVFVLVIKNCEITALPSVKNAILGKLRREHILWKFDLVVLNEELAKEKNLVLMG